MTFLEKGENEMSLTIRQVYATVDAKGEFVKSYLNEGRARDILAYEIDPRAETVTMGFCVFDDEFNVIPDEAEDFHFTIEEALEELNFLDSDYDVEEDDCL
jgi:hypothetical protein